MPAWMKLSGQLVKTGQNGTNARKSGLCRDESRRHDGDTVPFTVLDAMPLQSAASNRVQ
jgi:hypothetical protein